VRVAIYLVLTPFLLCIGSAALASALVEAAGQTDETSARVLVSVSSLMMIPLGVAFGRRYRQRSLRLPARLFLTPILLFFGCWFFAGLLVYATGRESRFSGTLGTVVALIFLLMVPLGVGLAWRYRHRSLRLPAHLILTPIILYFGWVLLWALLAWLIGQDWMVSGTGGTTAYIVALLMIPLGIAWGWLRYRHGARSNRHVPNGHLGEPDISA
jgi:hypothetical protein